MQLTRLAAELGGKPAIVMGATGATLTYRDLEARSNRIARLFRDRGLRPGDHIALLFGNTLDVFPVVWAAQRCGLFYTPVNWHLAESEAAYIVENCEARLLVSEVDMEPLASAIAGGLDRLVTGGHVDGVESLDAAVAPFSDEPVDDETEGYYMLYSSGTTGRPKGILPELPATPFGTGLPIDHLMAGRFGFGRDTVYLSPGPIYHAAPLGWTTGTVRNGGTVVVMEKFDAEQTLRLIERHGVTHGQFVPTMFVRMLKLPGEIRSRYDVSSLRVAVHAAAPCPVEVKEKVIDWFGPKLVEFYAGSEGSGFCLIDTPAWLTHKGSVGKPVMGEVHVCDDDGTELGPGEVGTVWFGGTRRFAYHRDPEKTASVHNDRGWSTLGDLGQVDEEGYLYLSDRRTDLILSGGVNIYPREIEDVLALHPAVEDVAVIGVPDPEFGQRVHAVVHPAGAARPELADELIAYCRDRLGHYKCPKTVSFADVPRLPSGKILRRELMKRHEGVATS
ncbi:acyl-CoA synthetase [Amycolatopsis acidiphila]|uniref:Acyl-CoA synthetase n=1 Tax=Amycolatopsis acidiphila TaxID=715473 RepID=A0A558AB08_9PSEU|nr:acyl-CoA synthetase [Amycolatopsis acidiphila]TVT21433.1 acyl-CoA synthetase [Amycolatopsis acidiphila]UIJ63105.1 acyl-CoA synthetase [Amycolatopsis acidiphila]GHG73766.1 long-chain acyl-CoA synthetase [Amycolatopsis acidiphila]